MANWKESLVGDLASREVEIQTLLERFQVKRKLTEIRDQIWGSGQVYRHRIYDLPYPIGYRLQYNWNVSRHEGGGENESYREITHFDQTAILVDLTDEPEGSFYLYPLGSHDSYTFWNQHHLGKGKLFLRVADDKVLLGHKSYVLVDPDSSESEKEFDSALRLSNLKRTQLEKLPATLEKRSREVFS